MLCFLAARQMARSALDEVTDTGAFDRSPSTFRSSVSSDASARFPTVPGRYHLYVSYACPWASRCLAFLKLKGLDHVIGVTVIPTSRQADVNGSLVSLAQPTINLSFLLRNRRP